MVYDSKLKKGVRKRYLAEPNPQKVELPRNATLSDVFCKAKYLFFDEVDPEVDINSFCLADSAGILIPIEDKDSWSISSLLSKESIAA